MVRQVANYITKLRGLKRAFAFARTWAFASCKLYHKTTWFETAQKSQRARNAFRVANYITKLRGLKLLSPTNSDNPRFRSQIISQNYVVWNSKKFREASRCLLLQIISQNYVVWNANLSGSWHAFLGCKLYHKTTWFETLVTHLNHTIFYGSCKLYHKTTWFETCGHKYHLD